MSWGEAQQAANNRMQWTELNEASCPMGKQRSKSRKGKSGAVSGSVFNDLG